MAVFENVRFPKPQINLAMPTAARIWLINLCAFMAIMQSAFSDSFSSLFVAIGAVSAAVLTEFFILRIRGRADALFDGSAVATALILTLLLPNQISPLIAAAGAVFAIAVIKHSFGGLGSNWLNPAAAGWLFIRFSWPASFSRALEGSALSYVSDSLSHDLPYGQATAAIGAFLNRTVFSVFRAELPGEYFGLFANSLPGIIADRGIMALLLGTIIITASKVSRSWIPAVFLAVFGILVRFLGDLPYGGEFWNGDVFFALCSGGTLAAAFFLAADPATGAKTKRGILLAAALGGALSFFFRYFGSEPYAAIFAALFVNVMLPVIRIIERRRIFL